MIPFTPPRRAVRRVFLHCSASDNPEHDDVQVIRRWHRERGFSDVGYHYVVTKAGFVQTGRPLERDPAAQEGHNQATIAICANGLAVDRFTPVQLTAVRDLCRAIAGAYRGRVTFHGHCEGSAKACPVFDYRGLLGLDAAGRMTPAA